MRRPGADGAAATLITMGTYGVLFCFGSVVRVREMDQASDDGRWAQNPYDDPICRTVAELSRPEDAILVSGFDGDVYVSCHRPPATPYVYTTMVVGVVPPFWSRTDDRWVAPRAREDTARVLRASPPPLVIENRERFGGRTLTSVPLVGDALRDGYCPPRTVEGGGIETPRRWAVYVRHDLGCDRLPSAPLSDRFAPFPRKHDDAQVFQ